ncbi:putative DNA-binding transcriptional regulator AlpA [Kitasatospora sp. GAS204A]|uniref:DNA-binding protein n=1 Tax=unclassified Kitasatospora TaxID=2633591 RepID=UPI00247465C0|nr:DNA-binding protein [Kitasatospora sp. GAS204B]MDH6122039.1 putative DNA-binding transcriptional regulator AlpA [Kitasatospora sp. GAS204B]
MNDSILTRDLLDLPPTVDVETAGKAFGLGRTTSYSLARSGQFPCKVIRVGRSYRVVTADLLRVLGLMPDTARRATDAA